MVRPSNSKPSLRVKILVGDLDRLQTLPSVKPFKSKNCDKVPNLCNFFFIWKVLRIPPLFRFQAKMTKNWSNTLIRYIENIFYQIWYPWRHQQKFSKFLFCPLVTSGNIYKSQDWYQNDQWVLSFKMMYNMTTFYIQWKKWSFWPLNRLLALSVVSVHNVEQVIHI